MIMPCPNAVTCPVEGPPLLGFDSDAQDILNFVGTAFGPLTPPPLGWQYINPTAFATVDSPISQQAADQAAMTAAIVAAESTWTPPTQAVGQANTSVETFSNQAEPDWENWNNFGGEIFEGEFYG